MYILQCSLNCFLFFKFYFDLFYITIIYIVHTCINNLQMNITKNSRLFCTTVWQKSFNIYLLVSNIKLRIHTYVFELITNYDIRCVLCSFLRFYIKNYHKVLCNTVIAQWRYYNIIIIAHNSFVSNMFICVWISNRYYFMFKGTKKKYYDVVFWISYYKCSIVGITAIGDHIRTHWFTQSLTV